MNIFRQIDTMLSKNKDKKFFISDLTERTLTYKDLNDNASKFTFNESCGDNLNMSIEKLS